jgi:hypothetical protein
MKAWTLSTAILVFAASASAKGLPPDASIIRYMKSYRVAKIDPRLGNQSYEAWLTKTLGPWKSISWEVDDCGESDASEPPICVSTTVQLDSCRKVQLSMVVGSTNGGISGVPMVSDLERSGVTPTDFLNSLVQLEPALRRARQMEPAFLARPFAEFNNQIAISFAKQIPVRRLSPSLPDISLEEWIERLADSGSQITWHLWCPDPTVSPGDLTGCNDSWASVEIGVDNARERFLIQIRIGTVRRGVFGEPVTESISLFNKRVNRLERFSDVASLETRLTSMRKH